MSSLLERADRRNRRGRGTSSDGAPVPLAPSTGMMAGLRAASISMVIVLVPVVLAWVGGGGNQSTLADALRVGGALWLLAHHVASTLPGGTLSLVPLGALAIPLLTCAVIGERLARTLDPRAQSKRPRPVPAPPSALLALVATYAAIATAVAALCKTEQFTPVLWQAPLGAGLVAAIGGWCGSQAYAYGGRQGLVDLAYELVPERAERFVAPTMIAIAAQLSFGAMALVAGVVLGFGRIGDMHAALHAGFMGSVVITLLQVLLLPNLVVWSAAWLAGPGFSIGSDTSVTLAQSTLGPIPAVPILGALPDPGPMPGWGAVGVFAGVLAGVLAGHRLLQETSGPHARDGGDDGLWSPVVDICVLTLASTAGFGLLCLLSSGSAGPGRLGHVGPVWAALPAFAIQVAIGAGLVHVVRLVAPAVADRWAERR